MTSTTSWTPKVAREIFAKQTKIANELLDVAGQAPAPEDAAGTAGKSIIARPAQSRLVYCRFCRAFVWFAAGSDYPAYPLEASLFLGQRFLVIAVCYGLWPIRSGFPHRPETARSR